MNTIYLDHHSTTPCAPDVAASMWPYFVEHFGNPGSVQHSHGRRALAAVEQARSQVAALIGANPSEIVFTGGATEANNLAIRGACAAVDGAKHVVTTNIEHPSVLETVKAVGAAGVEITILRVDKDGLVDVGDVRRSLRSNTVLVSVMLANNEIGTMQPVGEIAALCREASVLFHTDATQCVGHMAVAVMELGVDMLSLSAHKMYGPKGVGALWIRGGAPRVRLRALVTGGAQERGLRGGTLAVPQVVGFGTACSLASTMFERGEPERVRSLRDRLEIGLTKLAGVHVNGHRERRLGHNLSLRIDHVDASQLLGRVPHLALSTGSACASAKSTPSQVLTAIGLDEKQARSTIRIGLGRNTTIEEIDVAVETLGEAIRILRR